MVAEGDKIEYRTPGRLSDSLKLQFRCSLYVMRFFWSIAAIIAVVVLILSAFTLWDDPWTILAPVVAGVVAGTLWGPLLLIVRHPFRKQTEIKADIGDNGIRIIGSQGFSYEANWPNLTWIKEGTSAYVMRFNKLFVRLPKRGFAGQQEAALRALVRAHAPAAAVKLNT